MEIDPKTFLPSMRPTNTGALGAHMMNKDVRFQAELEKAQDRFKKSSSTVGHIMTDEEIAQRNKDIKDASVQMEGLLLKMLYKEMYKTVPKDELFGDDDAMDIYRDYYHEELTKKMAEAGGIGLADFIYEQLTIDKGRTPT